VKVAPRKVPVQSRSREMVDAILDGAVRAYLASAAPSVNRIAEIAGVSIGSVYQYFPAKKAIVAAVVRRRMREIHERLLEVIEASDGCTLEEAVARFVDAIFEMKIENTQIDEVIMRVAIENSLTDDAFALDDELVRRFADALDRWKPKVREDLPSEIAAHMLFQGLRAVLVVGAVARPDLTADERLRGEMRRLLTSYLS